MQGERGRGSYAQEPRLHTGQEAQRQYGKGGQYSHSRYRGQDEVHAKEGEGYASPIQRGPTDEAVTTWYGKGGQGAQSWSEGQGAKGGMNSYPQDEVQKLRQKLLAQELWQQAHPALPPTLSASATLP